MNLGNPAANGWSSALPEQKLQAAVDQSGYPVQSDVALSLRRAGFGVVEEWTYRDRASQELRALDLLALPEPDPRPGQRVRPDARILIECKRSRRPLVFFAAKNTVFLDHRLHAVVGLRSPDLHIATDDPTGTYVVPVQQSLGLDEISGLPEPAGAAHVFAAANLKGGGYELSGSDTYNGIVMPLISALAHLQQAMLPRASHLYFDCTLALMVAVYDGPMVLAEREDDGTTTLSPVPWVRVIRNEPHPDPEKSFGGGIRSHLIEVVHKDALDEWLDTYLGPLWLEWSSRVTRHWKILLDGRAYAPGYEPPFRNVEGRIVNRQG